MRLQHREQRQSKRVALISQGVMRADEMGIADLVLVM